VVGGSVPAVRDGWMWDLTVPGNNDHDFYVQPAGSVDGEASAGASSTAVLVHNDCHPDIAAAARAAARNAPEDATMTSEARIKGTDIGEVGYSGASSRPAFLEPGIEEAAQDGGQTFEGDAANCAEMGRPLDFSDIEFLTVRSSTGVPEAACLSCQSALVRRGATDLAVGG
jgi:hypothetical protein